MKSYLDYRKAKRRARYSNLASVGGLLVLLAGVLIPLFLPSLASISQVIIVIGLGTSMMGIYFANRWVRKPRPEVTLDHALRSLNDSYHLYHYPSLPLEHVLLTPSGVILIETVNLSGYFSFRNGRWKERMGFGRAMRYIVEEHLGNPTKAAQDGQLYLSGRLALLLGQKELFPVKSVVAFTHPSVDLDLEETPVPVCKADKLKKYVAWNAPKLAPEVYEKLDIFLARVTAGK
jgi:hypothetical protein